MSKLWRLIVIGFLGALYASPAVACSCGSYGPCHRLELKNTLFVGKVLSEAVVEPRTKDEWRRRVYRIEIAESFNGTQRPGDVVDVFTGMGGGDCGFGFAVGERYLVDAFDSGKGLATGICNVTDSERRATATIRELRAIRSGGRVPDLSGRIAIAASQAYAITGNSKPLPATLVNARSTKTGKIYQESTDADGIYTFEKLPPDEYSIKPELPSRLTTAYMMNGELREGSVKVTVPDGGSLGASCQIDVQVHPTGSIVGQVVDAEGKGVTGTVFAYPSPSEAPLEKYQWAGSAPVAKDGHFQMSGLREGSYQLMFEYEPPFDGNWANRKPLRLFYFQNAPSLLEGARIEVPDGKASSAVRFTLGKDFDRN